VDRQQVQIIQEWYGLCLSFNSGITSIVNEDEKMRIALMIASLTKGGAERVMVNLANCFIEQGHEVLLITQYEKENEYKIGTANCCTDFLHDCKGKI